MSKKNKTPTRSSPKSSGTPKATPFPSTPTIMKIGETLEAIKDAMPAAGISTLGLTPELVKPFVESQELLRSLLIVLAIAVVIIFIVLWAVGHTDSRDAVQKQFGTRVPLVVFDAWFVFLFLFASIAGFMFILMNTSQISAAFAISCFFYLLSLIMIAYKLYFNSPVGSSATQIWSFILIINAFFFGILVMQITNNPFLSILAIAPTVVYGGFTLYAGGIVAEE